MTINRRFRRRFPPVRLFGKSNGRAKLSDLEVQRMRVERAAHNQPYSVLGRKYGVDETHARKICIGISRTTASGPLEVGRLRDGTPTFDEFGGYDATKVIRCKCGALSHPSLKNPKVCIVCANS